MRFGLTANLHRIGAREAIDAVVGWADKHGHDLVLSDSLRSAAPERFRLFKLSHLAAQSEIVISMGGDGTLLSTARAVGASGKPVLGINLGSLGFLTQQTPEELISSLEAVVAGNFQIEERMLLKAETDGRYRLTEPFALNDIVLDRGPGSRILDINLRVNDEDVVTYKSDGLIIATPTGSTAYALAVGGPIMHPKMEAMIAAPIAAFSLTTRPMIFDGADVLQLSVLNRNEEANLTLDGQVGVAVNARETVTIRRADFRLKLITFPDRSFYKLLRNKLHWGRPANYHI
ncbi:MAG: NAD(+)/NADH kinase [Candidatus Zixiibacteriota bacterium]